MRAEYARHYRDLSERHWWWRAREAFVLSRLERLRRLDADPRPWNILDIGCGAGSWFDRLSRFGEVEGIEPDAESARDSPHRHRIQVAAFDADFQAEKPIDLVLLLDVLEHLEDDLGALRAIARSLRPGGRLVLTVPAFPWLWSGHDEINRHYRRYVALGLKSVLGQAGFQVETLHYFYHWTVAPLLVRRWVDPSGSKKAARIPQVPPAFLNRSLMLLSQVDFSLVPLRIPLGSSLYASARLPA
ncbi:MAG: class I SAM-dependent methyltransferase [Isosphaeraceae bacterium]